MPNLLLYRILYFLLLSISSACEAESNLTYFFYFLHLMYLLFDQFLFIHSNGLLVPGFCFKDREKCKNNQM